MPDTPTFLDQLEARLRAEHPEMSETAVEAMVRLLACAAAAAQRRAAAADLRAELAACREAGLRARHQRRLARRPR